MKINLEKELYGKNINWKLIGEVASLFLSKFESIGNPTRLFIELRKASETSQESSSDEIIREIDKEFSNSQQILDFCITCPKNGVICIIGVKL